MNKLRILFQVFLILVFLAGIYVVITFDRKLGFEGLENKNAVEFDCPDLLVRKGSDLLLYNTKKPAIEGINPVKFKNLDEYKKHLEIQRKEGIHCPVLFLQHEYDIQGKGVYRAYSTPLQMEGGITRTDTIPSSPDAINSMLGNSNIPLYNPTNYVSTPPLQPIVYKDDDKGMPVPIIDASREHGDYNKGNYAGFDPTSLYVGKYTDLDKIHDSTSKDNKQSDNPMDTNWGGVQYTQSAVDSGKYEENNITKPRLFQPKTVYDPSLPNAFPPPKDIV
jgi:hypothetical protein